MKTNKTHIAFFQFQKSISVSKAIFLVLLMTSISLSVFAGPKNFPPKNEKDTLTSGKSQTGTNKDCDGRVIVHKGLIYKTVYYEKRCWLDRNLGAVEVPKSLNDRLGYGMYFQWGRTMDGHEDYGSQVSFLVSGIDNPGIGSFTTSNNPPYDWRAPQNDSLWQNNPCPEGWRIPTLNEWGEVISNLGSLWEAFNSPLKIPASGFRNFSDGSYQQAGKRSLIWTSTSNEDKAYSVFFSSDEAIPRLQERAMGLPVRCIKQQRE
ncbi:MAG: hypothetical protein GXO89_10245 [Chlorobi bacterium]|nr:hypothetical protein [Chlorobiota bacterium]